MHRKVMPGLATQTNLQGWEKQGLRFSRAQWEALGGRAEPRHSVRPSLVWQLTSHATGWKSRRAPGIARWQDTTTARHQVGLETHCSCSISTTSEALTGCSAHDTISASTLYLPESGTMGGFQQFWSFFWHKLITPALEWKLCFVPTPPLT